MADFRVGYLVFCLLAAFPVLAASSAEDEVKVIQGKTAGLELALGISKTLEFPFELGPIYLTDAALLDFRRVKDGEGDRKLLLLPRNSGVTDMTVHDAKGLPRLTYIVRVTREDLTMVQAQLDSLLGDVEGLRITSLGGTLLLDGELLLPRDMVRIFRVLEAVKDRDPKKKEVPIRNLTTISRLTMNLLAERVEREIGSPEITVRVVNNNFFLEGTAESNFEADRAIEVAKTYLPELFVEKTKGEGGEVRPKAAGGIGGGLPTIVDLLRVRPRPADPPASDILITMNYVELSNEYSKSFNFQWRPFVTDNSQVKYDSALGEVSASILATVSSLFPKLETAKDHGHARILKQQSLIVKDGAEAPAIIDSSLQVYTRVVDEKGAVAFQPIEIKNSTKIRARTIPGSDTIELGIQIDLAAPVGAGGASPPSVARNGLQTQVTIRNGESAALGGNAFDAALAGYNRELPRGGQQAGGNGTPLVDLHRSKRFERTKTQYIIFLTPKAIRSAGVVTAELTDKFRVGAGER